MSFTRLCAILFVHQLEKNTNTQLIHEFIGFFKKVIFFQTEYERRGEVIVDFNDLL